MTLYFGIPKVNWPERFNMTTVFLLNNREEKSCFMGLKNSYFDTMDTAVNHKLQNKFDKIQKISKEINKTRSCLSAKKDKIMFER